MPTPASPDWGSNATSARSWSTRPRARSDLKIGPMVAAGIGSRFPRWKSSLMPDTVLIVDDDIDLAVTVQMVLEASGYQTVIASNGRAALEFVKSNMPSLIILDMTMPVMNGWEFARVRRE